MKSEMCMNTTGAEEMSLTSEEWEEPVEIEVKKPSKFNPDWLPSPFAEFVRAAADSLCVSFDLVGFGVIPILAICCQGSEVRVKDQWIEPCNIYAMTVSNPGTKKSPVLSLLRNPLDEWESAQNRSLAAEVARSKAEKEILESKLKKAKTKAVEDESAGDGEKKALELSVELESFKGVHYKRLLVDDCTPEKLAHILMEQEGKAAVLSSEGGIIDIISGRYTSGAVNVDLFLKAYNGEKVTMDRVNLGSKSIVLERPILTVYLSVQPTVLNSLISNEGLAGRGLVDRFIFCFPSEDVVEKFDTPEIPEHIRLEYVNQVRRLLSSEDRALYFTSDAKGKFKHFYDEFMIRKKTDMDYMAAWVSKIAGTVARIAGLLHLAEGCTNDYISGCTMEKAIEIGRYLQAHAEFVYETSGANHQTERMVYLIKKIREKTLREFTTRYLHSMVRGKRMLGFDTVENVKKTLEKLDDLGYIRPLDTEQMEGRPSEKYEANPYIFEPDFKI